MISWWESIILGIVEGVTEFLPVSSTGHLTIVENLLGHPVNAPTVTAYTAIIQVGAMLASIVYFWSDIVRIARAWFAGLANKHKRKADYHLGWAIIVGVAVTAVVGLLLKDLIEGPLRSMWFVAAGLVLWSVAMYVADRVRFDRGEDSITWKDGLLLGLFQSIALIPGVSRSGATIAGAMFLKIDRVTATRMSFFLGIPTLIAAGGLQAVTKFDQIGAAGGVGWGATIIGTVVSGIVAYLSIAWLLKFVSSNNFNWFVIYRVALGIPIALGLVSGVIAGV